MPSESKVPNCEVGAGKTRGEAGGIITNQCSQHSNCTSSMDCESIPVCQLHCLVPWFSSSNSGQLAGLGNTVFF